MAADLNFFEENPLPAWICESKTFRVIQVNKAAVHAFGYTRVVWLKNSLLARVEGKIDAHRSPVSCRIVHNDGRIFNIELCSNPVSDEKNGHVILIVGYNFTEAPPDTRVTDRPEDFRKAVEKASIISMTDKAGTITYVNDNFTRISGYTRSELLGQNHRIINSGYHPETFWAGMWQTIMQGQTWRAEVKNRAKDGKYYWVDTFIMPFLEKNGEVFEILSIRNDITERKTVEEEAKRLSLISRHSSNAVILTGKEGEITWVNESFERITEYKREEVLGKKPGSFLQGPDTDPRTVAHMHQCLQRKEGFRAEIVNYARSGRKYWVDVEVIPVKDEAGEVTGFMAIESDITVLKTAVREMLKSESLLQTIMDNAPVLVFLKDLDGRYTFYNQSFRKFYPGNYSRKVVTDYDLFSREEADKLRATDRRIVETRETLEFEQDVVANGQQDSYYTIKFPLVDAYDKVYAVGGIALRITERKLAEKSLVESESRYRSIVDDQQEMICRYRQGGRLTFVNKAYATMFRKAPEELIGQSFFELIPDEDRARVASYFQGVFEGTITPAHMQQQAIIDNGSQRWLEWFDIPLRNSKGEIYEVQSIGHDITHRKRLESEQARLDKIVRESYNEIYLFNWESLRFEFANASALRNIGYRHDELVTMKLSDLFSYPDEMALQVLLAPLRRGETDRLQLQIKHSRKDGTYYDVDTLIQVLEKDRSFVAIATDITQKLGTEKKLLATILEKETLIKEIHHRVKNNLQLISSIIYIKMSSLKEPEIRYFLEDTRQKIRSISLIHERLLQSETLDKVEISDYLGKLIYDLKTSNSPQDLALEIKCEIQENVLDVDTAIYCGLIVNELITNAIKHAFRGRKEGVIEVLFKRVQKDFILAVQDNGITIPVSVEPGRAGSFGMHLLEIFVRQLGGTIEVIREKGTKFQIRF